MTERIDVAIDRLDEALRAAGLPGAEAPAEADAEALAEIAKAVAPHRLPDDLHRFWERVEFGGKRGFVAYPPDLLTPKPALDTYRMNLEEFPYLFGPPLLFPIARHSGDQLSVELVSEWGVGGIVFSHSDSGYEIVYPDFAHLIEVWAELVEERAFEAVGGTYALQREPRRAKQEERFHAASPHPLYGEARQIPRDAPGWPAHWLAAAGIDPESRVPRGATHTLAELVHAAEQGEVVGRVVGAVAWMGGSSDGVIVVVDDGATQLDAWFAMGTSAWGPSSSSRLEFELAVRKGGNLPRDIASGPLRELLAHISREGPSALALDIRPADG